jgi:hypothetical protein
MIKPVRFRIESRKDNTEVLGAIMKIPLIIIIMMAVLLSTATAIDIGIIGNVGSSISSYDSTPDNSFSSVTELT